MKFSNNSVFYGTISVDTNTWWHLVVWEQIASKWENAPICLPCQVFCTWPSCHLSLTSRRAQLGITKFKEAIGKTDIRFTEEMGRWAQPTFKHKCATWVTEKNSSHVVRMTLIPVQTLVTVPFCAIGFHWMLLIGPNWFEFTAHSFSYMFMLKIYSQTKGPALLY